MSTVVIRAIAASWDAPSSTLNDACGRTKTRVSCTLAHPKLMSRPTSSSSPCPLDASRRRDHGSIAMPERSPRHLHTPLLGQLIDGLQSSNAHVRICIRAKSPLQQRQVCRVEPLPQCTDNRPPNLIVLVRREGAQFRYSTLLTQGLGSLGSDEEVTLTVLKNLKDWPMVVRLRERPQSTEDRGRMPGP